MLRQRLGWEAKEAVPSAPPARAAWSSEHSSFFRRCSVCLRMLCGMAPCQLQTEDNHAAFAASFGILIFGGGKKARRRGQGLLRSLREAAGPAALLERPLGSGHRGAFCSLDHLSAAARARARAPSLQDVATGRWAEAAARGGARGGEGPAPRPSWLGPPFLAGLWLCSLLSPLSSKVFSLKTLRSSLSFEGLQCGWRGGSGRCSPRPSRPRVAGGLRRAPRTRLYCF